MITITFKNVSYASINNKHPNPPAVMLAAQGVFFWGGGEDFPPLPQNFLPQSLHVLGKIRVVVHDLTDFTHGVHDGGVVFAAVVFSNFGQGQRGQLFGHKHGHLTGAGNGAQAGAGQNVL